jgi:sugar lactone lactonase YvrE
VGKDLYVADKTKIVKVSSSGQTQVFAPASAFPVVPQFLNDLEADQTGNLYVSDSGDLKGHDGAIYKISAKGEVTLIANSVKNKLVQSPNGLLMLDKDTLLEVDFASGILFRVTISTGELKPVANGFGGGDGITRGKNGVLYVSDWQNGRVFSVNKDNEVKLLLDGFQSSADISISADGRYILVPDMKAGELIWLLIE